MQHFGMSSIHLIYWLTKIFRLPEVVYKLFVLFFRKSSFHLLKIKFPYLFTNQLEQVQILC